MIRRGFRKGHWMGSGMVRRVLCVCMAEDMMCEMISLGFFFCIIYGVVPLIS